MWPKARLPDGQTGPAVPGRRGQDSDRFPETPLVAYNVSGEYAMIKAAARLGWLDKKQRFWNCWRVSNFPGLN